MNTLKLQLLVLASFGILLASTIAYALDIVESTLPAATATGLGSTGNTLSIFTGAVQYINTDNDSTTVGNSFSGSYYDSTHGSFKLNWSTNKTQNVRIGQPTSRCITGYGYQLTGAAQSPLGWFIQFAQSSVNFVYYCEDTGLLYGFGYGEGIGWQNFNGLKLRSKSQSNIVTNWLSNLNDPFNFNRTTTITDTGAILTPNERRNALEGDVIGNSDGKESVFYIVK